MKAVIFDMDGMLSNVDHRLHFLEGERKDWNSFFEAMGDDGPNDAVMRLLQNMHHNYRIIIVTARPAEYTQKTIAWLGHHLIPFDKIYTRKSGDFRQDAIVKQEILQQILDDGYDPFLAVDDRKEVVEMWRSFGITTLQCAPDENPIAFAGQNLLTMMVGPSGAGKSSYVDRNFLKADVISTDDIRALHGWTHSPEDLKKTWDYVHGMIRVRLKCGIKTVLDATNIKQKDRLKVLSCVPRGQYVQYLVIDRTLDDKIAYRAWRPEELIIKHHKIFKSEIKNILAGDNQSNVVVLDERQHKI